MEQNSTYCAGEAPMCRCAYCERSVQTYVVREDVLHVAACEAPEPPVVLCPDCNALWNASDCATREVLRDAIYLIRGMTAFSLEDSGFDRADRNGDEFSVTACETSSPPGCSRSLLPEYAPLA
jgi:hypothetical protein